MWWIRPLDRKYELLRTSKASLETRNDESGSPVMLDFRAHDPERDCRCELAGYTCWNTCSVDLYSSAYRLIDVHPYVSFRSFTVPLFLKHFFHRLPSHLFLVSLPLFASALCSPSAPSSSPLSLAFVRPKYFPSFPRPPCFCLKTHAT